MGLWIKGDSLMWFYYDYQARILPTLKMYYLLKNTKIIEVLCTKNKLSWVKLSQAMPYVGKDIKAALQKC